MSKPTAQEAGASVPPPRENLIRALPPGIELVRADGEAMPTLAGHFAVFDQWTEINSVFEGNFMERFAPGSFAKTIREGRAGMKVLFQHGQDPQMGNKPLGPIRSLKEDATGASYEVPLLDTSYNRDLIPGLEAGLYGASFRFKVMQEEFVAKPKASRANPDGLPERTVTEAQVREFGPVTFPAYAGASAGLRSLTDDFLFARFVDDPDKLMELLEAYRSRRDDEPERAAMPMGMSMMPAGVKACSMSGTPGYTGGNTCHVHDGSESSMKAAMAKAQADAKRSIEEPEPSAATTPPRTEPEPSGATTRAKAHRAGIYPYREEKPSWLL